MADKGEKKPGMATGPTTPEGKERSARNATTHGVRAKNTLILPDETQEEFDRVKAGWMAEYGPHGYAEERLVEEVYLNDWFLKRAMRRLQEAEAKLLEHIDDSEEELARYEKRVDLMLRYKTTQERSFHRALGAVQAFRRDLAARTKHFFAMNAQTVELAQSVASRCHEIQQSPKWYGAATGQQKSVAEALERVRAAIVSLEEDARTAWRLMVAPLRTEERT